MEFVKIPDRLSFSHLGTFSPILMRLEGGDDCCGYCITEHRHTGPTVSVYGDPKEARELLAKTLRGLPACIEINIDRGSVVSNLNRTFPEWFSFEYRPGPWNVRLFLAKYSASMIWDGLNTEPALARAKRDELVAAAKRLSEVYARAYNVNP